MARKHNFQTVNEILRKYGLRRVFDFTSTLYTLPSYCRQSAEAFVDCAEKSSYGAMFLDEKLIEWANEGEIDRHLATT